MLPRANNAEQQEQQQEQQPPPPPPPRQEAEPLRPAPPEAIVGAPKRKLQKLKQLPIEKQLSETRKPIRRQAPRSQIIEEKLRKEKPWAPSSSPTEKQLARAKALEQKIAELSVETQRSRIYERKLRAEKPWATTASSKKKTSKPHWKQESVTEEDIRAMPREAEGKAGEAVAKAKEAYENIVYMPSQGWLRVREELGKKALEKRAEAGKVEVERVKLPPHLQEELGVKTVPSYEPNVKHLEAFGYALGASAASFTAGVMAGLADVAAPWRILEEAEKFVRDPYGRLKKTYLAIQQNPLNISFMAGEAVGTYLGFKAVGKGISKLAGKRRVTYELIPEKTEGKVVFSDNVAMLKLKHYGRAIKVPGGSSTGAADIASTPKFQFVDIEASGLYGRIQISGGRLANKGALYLARDIIRSSRIPKKPASWVGEELYLLADESATKSIALDLLLRARSLKGAPSAGTAISATPSASLIQELLGKTLLSGRMSRTVTIFEPRFDINLSPGAVLSLLQPIEEVANAAEKVKETVAKETKSAPSTTSLPQPLRGQLPRAKSKTQSSGEAAVNTLLDNILEADLRPIKSHRHYMRLLKQHLPAKKTSAHARKLRQHYRKLMRTPISIKEKKLEKLDKDLALTPTLTPKSVPKKTLRNLMEPKIRLDIPQELVPIPRIGTGTSLTQLTQLLPKPKHEKPKKPRRTPSGEPELPWFWPEHRRGYAIFRKRMEGYFERLWRFLTPQKLLGIKTKKKKKRRRKR